MAQWPANVVVTIASAKDGQQRDHRGLGAPLTDLQGATGESKATVGEVERFGGGCLSVTAVAEVTLVLSVIRMRYE